MAASSAGHSSGVAGFRIIFRLPAEVLGQGWSFKSKDERKFTPIGGVDGVYSMKRLR